MTALARPGTMPSLLCPPPPPMPGVAAVSQVASTAVGGAPGPSAGSTVESAPDRGMLGRLAGVNRSDDLMRERELDESARNRTRPRLTLTPMHALVIMLLLVGALAASLTLLARQAMNAARVDGDVVAAAAAGESQQSEPGPSSGVTASPSGSSSSSPSPDDGRVNLNTAGVAQLDAVKGIGPAIAQRIVDHRNRNGPFSSVDDLLDVPGIGPKTLAKMRDQLVVR